MSQEDEDKKKKKKNGLSFKDALEASQTDAGKKLTKPKPAKKSNGGGNAEGALKAGIALSKTLANASGAKKYRDAGIEAFKGTPVQANDGGVSDSMDITSFHNAYGSRNTDNTGVDMGNLKAKDLELTPAEKRKLKQYNSNNGV